MRSMSRAAVACVLLALACGRTGVFRTADGGLGGFGGGAGTGGSGAGGGPGPGGGAGGGIVPAGCRVDKLQFSPADACDNDGFWEFCAADDPLTQRRLLTSVPGAVPASFGSLRCGPGEKEWLLTALECFGAGNTDPLSTLCTLAADPAVSTVVQGALQ